jgi:hypothetical protein
VALYQQKIAKIKAPQPAIFNGVAGKPNTHTQAKDCQCNADLKVNNQTAGCRALVEKEPPHKITSENAHPASKLTGTQRRLL